MDRIVQLLVQVEGWFEDSLNGEDGQGMIEYSLLAALISIVAVALILLVGPYISGVFQSVADSLAGV